MLGIRISVIFSKSQIVIFIQNMDFLTAENQCKWGYAEPEYYGCTNTLEFAESCNMDFRYTGSRVQYETPFMALPDPNHVKLSDKNCILQLAYLQVPRADLRRRGSEGSAGQY